MATPTVPVPEPGWVNQPIIGRSDGPIQSAVVVMDRPRTSVLVPPTTGDSESSPWVTEMPIV